MLRKGWNKRNMVRMKCKWSPSVDDASTESGVAAKVVLKEVNLYHSLRYFMRLIWILGLFHVKSGAIVGLRDFAGAPKVTDGKETIKAINLQSWRSGITVPCNIYLISFSVLNFSILGVFFSFFLRSEFHFFIG